MGCHLLGDTAATLYWAEIALQLSNRHAYRLGQAMAAALAGWAKAKRGSYRSIGCAPANRWLNSAIISLCCVGAGTKRALM